MEMEEALVFILSFALHILTLYAFSIFNIQVFKTLNFSHILHFFKCLMKEPIAKDSFSFGLYKLFLLQHREFSTDLLRANHSKDISGNM